jgi:hypothetical protein
MSSFEPGSRCSRDSSSVPGSITAVLVKWWVKADSNATDGMTTAMARVSPRPAQRPRVSARPVRCTAALRTKMAATTIAAWLATSSADDVSRMAKKASSAAGTGSQTARGVPPSPPVTPPCLRRARGIVFDTPRSENLESARTPPAATWKRTSTRSPASWTS